MCHAGDQSILFSLPQVGAAVGFDGRFRSRGDVFPRVIATHFIAVFVHMKFIIVPVSHRVQPPTPNQALQTTPRLRLGWHVVSHWRGVSELDR